MTTYLYALAAIVGTVALSAILFRSHLRCGMHIAKALARDERLPRHLRLMLAFGILPIPGPVDDLILIIAGVLIMTRHRATFRAIIAESAV